MGSFEFEDFEDLISGVDDVVLMKTVALEMRRYACRTDGDDGADRIERRYRTLFDKADKFSRTKREERLDNRGTPNTSRVDEAARGRGRGNPRPFRAVYYCLLFEGSSPAFAESISEELFRRSFFYEFEKELLRWGLKPPPSHPPSQIAHLGDLSVSLGFHPGARLLNLPPPDSDAIFREGAISPFEALKWNNRLSRLAGRDAEMAALVEWANDDDPRVKVHLLNGPGGVGKTRLAADFAEDRFSKKWSAGFLPWDINAATVLDGTGAGVLLIVDNPEERTELVKGIIKSVSNDEQYDRPIRILLVSREDQAAWERVSNYDLKRFSMTSLDSSGSLPVEEALRVVEEAVDILADEGNLPLPDTAAAADWLAEHPLNRRPLYALAGAVHAMLAPGNAFMLSGAALLKDLTKIERSRVRSFSKRDFGDAESLELLLALGILSGEGLSKETLYALGGLGVVPGRAGAHLLQAIKKTPFWIAPIGEEQDGHLQRLAPDKLAVAFLDAVLLEDPVRELPAWMAPPALQAESFGDILARLCFDLREIDGAHSRFLEQTAIKMLENQPDLIGTFEGLAWKEATPFSAGFVAAVIERLLENADDPAQCAVLAGNLAKRLSDLGRREEALAVAEEAVGLRRDLAVARPEAFLPDLALSLNNLANMLSDLGRREEALAAAKEAVSTLRPLFLSEPFAFERMMRVIRATYLACYSANGRAPDQELLTPIEALLGDIPIKGIERECCERLVGRPPV